MSAASVQYVHTSLVISARRTFEVALASLPMYWYNDLKVGKGLFFLRDFSQLYCVQVSLITVSHLPCWGTHKLCQSSKRRLLPDGLIPKQVSLELLLGRQTAVIGLWLPGKGREMAQLGKSWPVKYEDPIWDLEKPHQRPRHCVRVYSTKNDGDGRSLAAQSS